jgi:hypothetical protein
VVEKQHVRAGRQKTGVADLQVPPPSSKEQAGQTKKGERQLRRTRETDKAYFPQWGKYGLLRQVENLSSTLAKEEQFAKEHVKLGEG